MSLLRTQFLSIFFVILRLLSFLLRLVHVVTTRWLCKWVLYPKNVQKQKRQVLFFKFHASLLKQENLFWNCPRSLSFLFHWPELEQIPCANQSERGKKGKIVIVLDTIWPTAYEWAQNLWFLCLWKRDNICEKSWISNREMRSSAGGQCKKIIMHFTSL